MLKDKSCYATEKAYAIAYFVHKGIVKDYLIDPLAGSFIRVVHPSPDQPVVEKGWVNRPQFMFMNRQGSSRMYELSDINSLIRGVEQIYSNVLIDSGSFTVGMGKPDRQVLFVSSEGEVKFKDANDGEHLLINRVSETAPTLTPERQSKVTEKLLEAVLLISDGEDPKDDLLILDNEVMTTVHRPDLGMRSPVIITARRIPGRMENYIILHSDKQRIYFPEGMKYGAEALIDKYFSIAGANSEELQGEPAGEGRITMINPHPVHDFDPNMEYVHCRVKPFSTGNQVLVILNSDRYDTNTKFIYHYDRAFHSKLHHSMLQVARAVKDMTPSWLK